jgi:2-polyprenyl-3-methyl-5-hydroxy-6-metoxy-1,4-benzoquinol methylase
MNAIRSDESPTITKQGDPQVQEGGANGATANTFEAYDAKVASADLRKYRTSGPRPWTGALIEALKIEGVGGATLLDIGGGIGAIQHELLDAGATMATSVEASHAYLSAAREETNLRGHTGRVAYQHGDFVELAAWIPPADIVTLERVLNVYPDWELLARLSAERARRLYGIVIPRDTRFVRLAISTINLVVGLRRLRVRAAVVPIDALDRILREQGLHQCFSQTVGPAWRVLLYRRE